MRYRGTSGIMRVRAQTKRWRDRSAHAAANRHDEQTDDRAPCTCTCERCQAGEHDVCGRIACEERAR